VALAAALRCFFVAQENRRMAKKQIGGELANAEIERNPFNARYDASLPWPAWGTEAEGRFACVGRLYPPAKGQDILFEAFAQLHSNGDAGLAIVNIRRRVDAALFGMVDAQ
jgi:hypothetical protein